MVRKMNAKNPTFQYSMFHLSSIPICFLCALCFLFVHPLVFIPGGSKGKEEPISIK